MVHRILSLIAGFVIIINITSPAQQLLFNGSSSAGALNQPVIFNCDFYDPVGLPGVEVNLHYRAQDDTTFNDLQMQIIGDFPFYLFTYETQTVFSTNPGTLEFYFSGGTDTIKATQSPKNPTNQFPPASYLYAPFSSDPAGDTTAGSAGGWLDLTGYGMTYSDSTVFGYLENVSGTWPLYQGLTPFVYVLGFVPNITDSTIYAMTYASIPFVISPGLYKLSLADTSFTLLGDIDFTVEDNLLHFACDIATFANDPNWPGWPPPNGFIITIGATLSLSGLTPSINDFTYPTFYEPKTQYTNFNSNNPPQLYNYDFNMIPGISLTALASYYDPDNHLPVVRSLYFGYGHYNMGSYDHTYIDTAEFQHTLAWQPEGWHYYYFKFSDGVDTITTPFDSIYTSPIGIEDISTLPQTVSLSQNYPNPFNSSTSISFALDRASLVSLTIYDLSGRLVDSVVEGYFETGTHSITWNVSKNTGQNLPSGIYFYKLTAGEKSVTRKMVYLK